jgi:hypothetical protein
VKNSKFSSSDRIDGLPDERHGCSRQCTVLLVSHFWRNKYIGNWTMLFFFFLFSLFPFISFPDFLVSFSEMSRKLLILRRLHFKTELSSLSLVIVTNVSSVLRRIIPRSELKAIFFVTQGQYYFFVVVYCVLLYFRYLAVIYFSVLHTNLINTTEKVPLRIAPF